MVMKLYLGNLSIRCKMRILSLNFYKGYVIQGSNGCVLSTILGSFGKAGYEFNKVLVEAFSFVFVVFWFQSVTEGDVGHLLLNRSNGNNEILLIYCKKLFFMNFFQFMLLIANGCSLLKCAEESSDYISSVLFTTFEHCYQWERKILLFVVLYLYDSPVNFQGNNSKGTVSVIL